jgi:hypothetical protein
VSQVVDVYKKIIDACPYCGAMEMGMHTGIIDYRVACPSCSATGPLHKDISTAISLWNTVSKSWYNQSLTTHMPPAKEVSDETCDQLRRENDLLEEMISDRLGSLGELEREGYRGEPEPGGEPGELELEGEPGEPEREGHAGDFHDLDSVGCGGDPLGWLKKKELELEGEPGELHRGGDPGELELEGEPGELELEGEPGELHRGVSPKTFIIAMKLLYCEKLLKEILSIMSKK